MKRQKLMAWLLSIAMAASLAAPAYADDFDTSSDFEEEGFFEEDIDDEMDLEEETVEEFEALETDSDEEMIEEESEKMDKYFIGKDEGEGELELDLSDLPSDDELFAEYVDGELGVKMFSDGTTTERGLGYQRLTGDNRTLYKQARVFASDVADGHTNVTEFYPDLDELNCEFTYEELGIDGWIQDDEHDLILQQALFERFDIKKVLDYLLIDCAYDLYWYDKTTKMNVGYRTEFDDQCAKIISICFKFAPNPYYSTDESYRVDTEKTGAAVNAAANAQSIVDIGADLSDYEKLLYYKDVICEFVTYNEDAVAEDYDGGYGDPWQLIYVFDGDPETNVVCEGYSKAFQYLYELSAFDGDIDSRLVTGPMQFGTGAGPHMWNIVNMEDGYNYIVDVTNSDEGTSGENGEVFLGGTAGDVYKGYKFVIDENNYLVYGYDSEMFDLYTEDELTLASENYTPAEPPEEVLAEDIELDVTSQKIKNGESFQLTAYISPADTTNTEVTWTSSKPKYATVSEDGLVTAVCPGSAVITCATTDGSNLKATCTITIEPADDIEAFVVRLYSTCLNRKPDATGFKYWVDRLRSKKETGCSVAHGFIFSDEFINRKYNDEDFIEQMYKAFFGRGSDKGGKAYWLNEMKKGKTREDVFYGFADSIEFDRICKEYGIIKRFDDEPILAMHLQLNVTTQKIKNGDTYQLVASVSPDKTTNKAVTWTSSKPKIATVSDQGLVTALLPGTTVITCTTADGSKKQATCTITVEQADDIEAFVIRLYTTCLNRNPDAAGLKYWTDRMRTKKETGRSIVHGFVFSDEFIKRGYSDEQFINQMYKAFFGRNPDSAGKTYWLNEMKKGKTREQVFDGFAMSNEFDKLCKQYGIDRD